MSRTGEKREWGDVCQGQEISINMHLSQTLVLELGCLYCIDSVHLHKMKRLLEEMSSDNVLQQAYKDWFLLGLTTLILSLPSCKYPLKIP